LPAWAAVMVQVPTASRVTVEPETVQNEAFAEVKLTGRPDDAVALTTNGAAPMFWSGSAANVMDCVAIAMAKLCETAVAAVYPPLPAWVAAIPQVPTASRVTVLPETEQIDGVVEAKLTGRPEEAVAFKLIGAALKVTGGSAGNVMLCASPLTVKLCCTWEAAEYVPLPDWFASRTHVPEAINVAVVPEVMQTPAVSELKETANPDVAVATSVSGVPTICAPGFAKAILCVASITITGAAVPVAGLYAEELKESGV